MFTLYIKIPYINVKDKKDSSTQYERSCFQTLLLVVLSVWIISAIHTRDVYEFSIHNNYSKLKVTFGVFHKNKKLLTVDFIRIVSSNLTLLHFICNDNFIIYRKYTIDFFMCS